MRRPGARRHVVLSAGTDAGDAHLAEALKVFSAVGEALLVDETHLTP